MGAGCWSPNSTGSQLPMNTTLVLAPAAAAPAVGGALRRPTLGQCLLLAALLHLWLVVLVGTAPGGAARPGDGVWSSLQIRLGGPGPADSPGRADTPVPVSGPVGRAPEPRFGGTVRDAESRPSPEPGAAELGVWSTRPSPTPLGSPQAPAQVHIDPLRAAAPPVLTRRDPQAPERREDRTAPALLAPAPAATEPPPRPAPDAMPARSTAPRLAPADTVEAPVLERPPQTAPEIANPAATATANPRPLPAPAPQREERSPTPPPAQAPPPAPALAPVAPPVPPAVPVVPPLSAAAPPLPEPTPQPVAMPPPRLPDLPPRPPAAVESSRAVEPPLPMPAPPPPSLSPAPAPTPPAPAPAAAAPAPPPPVPAATVEPPRQASVKTPTLRPVDATELQRTAAPELTLPPVRAADPAPAAVSTVRDAPLPSIPSPPPLALPGATPGGTPAAGARLGTDRATAPSAAASGPRLNLELPRARATLPGLATPRVLNLLPPPPERKSPLAESIEKSAKPDCRKAYSGMGALAVVPLVVDAVRDGGCRW